MQRGVEAAGKGLVNKPQGDMIKALERMDDVLQQLRGLRGHRVNGVPNMLIDLYQGNRLYAELCDFYFGEVSGELVTRLRDQVVDEMVNDLGRKTIACINTTIGASVTSSPI